MSTLYDRIGSTYGATRGGDPRIADAIRAALADATSVVNVGAGTGAYEPRDRDVVAVEPSATMISQRPRGSPPVVQASAEELPLADKSFDAALAVNTLQHWTDLRAGLRELSRVARERVVIFLRDPQRGTPFWLVEDYLPTLDPASRMSSIIATIEQELQPLDAIPVPLPRDCVDGMFTAYWGRPEMYLDPETRQNISNFALAPEADIAAGIARLERALTTGAWDSRYRHLRSLQELDLGHRLLIARPRP
jgi:SAM-dependent methyltransferase